MKRLFLLMVFAPLAFADLLTLPTSFGGPYCLSAPFGSAACSITNQYDNGGLVFSNGAGTATFNDGGGVFGWAGITAGTVDLLTPVDVQIVVPGTTSQGVTSKVSVEAGFAADGALLLSVFDGSHNLLASRLNGLDGLGPDGRHLITILMPGIEFFEVSSPVQDTFGVNQITIAEVTAPGSGDGSGDGSGSGATVPEPTSVLLFGTLLACLVPTLRRRLRQQHI